MKKRNKYRRTYVVISSTEERFHCFIEKMKCSAGSSPEPDACVHRAEKAVAISDVC